MLATSQSRRIAAALMGWASLSACVDKAPPATWPEPPPPVLAKPVGGESVTGDVGPAAAQPSQPLEGTNDPSEGSVSLEAESADPAAVPADEEAAATEPQPDPEANVP